MPTPPTFTGLLEKFPEEIREMIYALVLGAGSTSITRVSKFFYEDTKKTMGEFGVCRIGTEARGSRYHPINGRPPVECRARIQNLRVTVRLPGDPLPQASRRRRKVQA